MGDTLSPPSIWCNDRFDMGGGLFYTCTRAKGHSGNHFAENDKGTILKVWPQLPARSRLSGIHAEEPDV